MRSSHIRDKPAHERMLRARSILAQSHPFFASLALHMELRERPGVPTLQVDGKHLDYNPAYLATLSEPEHLGAVAHETLHIALLHHTRRGSRDPEEWNVSCDLSINQRLIDEGFTLPKGALLDPSFKGMSAEQIYAERRRRKEEEQRQQPEQQDQDDEDEEDEGGEDPAAAQPDPDTDGDEQGDGDGQGDDGDDQGDGQGSGTGAGDGQGTVAPDPGGCGGVVDAALDDGEGIDQAEAQAEAMVRQCAAVASAGLSEMPEGIARILEELNQPRVNWREEFNRFVDSVATSQPTWNRPDKRMLALGYYLPGRTPDAVDEAVCIVDTSASIPSDGCTAFASEVQGMLDTGRVSRIHVVSVDDAVRNVQTFELGDTVEILDLQGGGGTRFDVGFEWAAANAPDAAAIIYLTDLDVWDEAWGQPPACPVLWTVYGPLRRVPWGEVIPLDPYQ